MTPPKPLTIFFSAGEPSGDLHAANLIRQLKARSGNVEAVGYGGPQMQAAGCRLHADLTALAVMWLARALLNLHKFWDLASRADRYFRHHRPDAVVLVDYPGFNWWIAWRAKVHGIPVFYYCPPQVWAWARWRVKKMRRLIDHVLASLPFEAEWFRQKGCNATFIGHPFFDEVRRQQLDEAFVAQYRERPGPLVTILPGSRTQEVTANLESFLDAAAIIRQAVPQARFAVAAFKPRHAEFARQAVARRGEPLDVQLGRTTELIHLADCCMAVSGSVSLELLCHLKPTVIQYKISSAAFFAQKFCLKVKYITLVNLLATDEVFPKKIVPYDPSRPDAEEVLFPEYLTCTDKSPEIAAHVIEWLTQPEKLSQRVESLRRLREKVAHGGASGQAADYILQALNARERPLPRPHFVPARSAVPDLR